MITFIVGEKAAKTSNVYFLLRSNWKYGFPPPPHPTSVAKFPKYVFYSMIHFSFLFKQPAQTVMGLLHGVWTLDYL